MYGAQLSIPFTKLKKKCNELVENISRNFKIFLSDPNEKL